MPYRDPEKRRLNLIKWRRKNDRNQQYYRTWILKNADSKTKQRFINTWTKKFLRGLKMILKKQEIDRIKWQFSSSPNVIALADSHEELRALLKEAFQRSEFYSSEDEVRLKCLEALESK